MKLFKSAFIALFICVIAIDANAALRAVSGVSAGSGVPGGIDGQVQYNNNGVFGGIAATGSGSIVKATSPTLITPLLGTPTSGVMTNVTGTAANLTAGHVTTNANLTGPITSTGNATSIASSVAGTGLSTDNAALTSNAVYSLSFQPGLLTAVSTAKSGFAKVSKTSTVDNIEGSAQQFSCVGNPTVTMYECGTSATCSSTPVTIGSATVTAAGTVVDGTVSNAAITAGDYVAFAISAGTCATLDIALTAQVHSD